MIVILVDPICEQWLKRFVTSDAKYVTRMATGAVI
jgi:hypothetical protein